MKPSIRDPACDRLASQAEGDQLTPRHDTVLVACELGDPLIQRPSLQLRVYRTY